MIKKIIFFMILIALVFFIQGNTIFEAASIGDIKAVEKMLLENPKLLHSVNDAGWTPLHAAVSKGRLDVVQLLLKKGAEVNRPENTYRLTPLHIAARGGQIEIAQVLLENGADLEARENDNETAIYYAAVGGGLDMVKFLVAKGANVLDKESKVGVPPVFYAATRNKGNAEIVKYMLSLGADLKWKGDKNWTMLHEAAWEGKIEVIQLLVDSGIPADAKTDFGRTPLHNACLHGNIEAVKALIEKGADVNYKSSDEDFWPLFLAVKRGYKDIAALLLASGADVEIKTRDKNRTALHIAAIYGYAGIVDLLLANGAEPNVKDYKDKTPLYYAGRYSHKKAATLLIGKGANKEDLVRDFDSAEFLKKEIAEGNAFIWYTGHSGWVVKTRNHLLIFDYWKQGALPDTPSMANGTIAVKEIAGLKTTVFSSHSHGDHYMPTIFEWKKEMPDIAYIMGFKPKDQDGYTYLEPRQEKKLDGMKITTILSNDSGLGFYVEVDGVGIYHPGDHANRKRDFSGPFKEEIDFLAEKGFKPDIMFAPVSGCGFGDLEAVKQGVYYTIKKLSPRTVFPMHAGGGEERYAAFAREAQKEGFDVPFCCAENSGDVFFVGQKGIKGALKAEAKENHGDKEKPCAKKEAKGCK